jgi:hypothetical protein
MLHYKEAIVNSTLAENKHRSDLIWLIYYVQRHFQQYLSYIMATSFNGGGSRSTLREPPIMGKQLVDFITCNCESSAPFFVIYKAVREPTLHQG